VIEKKKMEDPHLFYPERKEKKGMGNSSFEEKGTPRLFAWEKKKRREKKSLMASGADDERKESRRFTMFWGGKKRRRDTTLTIERKGSEKHINRGGERTNSGRKERIYSVRKECSLLLWKG